MAHTPRKRFGQNFLHDHNVIYEILASVNAQKGQRWIEIGPGQGALTEPLLKAGVDLNVIELDRDLVNYLGHQFKDYQNLQVHSADALAFDFKPLLEGDEPVHIIGNLPYNISTPLMFHLLSYAANIEDMHFMLQKQVVDRICAEPNTKKYGKLSIMMQYYCEVEALFDVHPESFNPPPKVTSAIVRLSPYRQLPIVAQNHQCFTKTVTEAFSQRRKTLRNSLSKTLNEQAIGDLGINPALRAEAITLEEYIKLSDVIYQQAQ